MIIRDSMKKNVFSVPVTAKVRDAVSILVRHHVGLLPVLDSDQRPVGVVGIRDLLTYVLPSALHLLTDVDFIGDFGALENFRPDEKTLSQEISVIMRPATFVREESGLIRAYAFMIQHDLHDLPVVDETGRLSGIASRVDIGTKILASWL
jgi:CBS domain-containing protein